MFRKSEDKSFGITVDNVFNKSIKAIALAIVLAFSIQIPAFAKYTYSNKMFDGKNFYHTYNLYVNNKEIKTPLMTSKETNMVNVVYVPLQVIVNAMGDKFLLSGKTATVTKKDRTKIVMQANSCKLTINGKPEQFMYKVEAWDDYSYYYPIIKNGIFYVPLDGHFSRIFGYELHEERVDGPKTANSISETYTVYIGKAPDRFYVKSIYPFIYQYQIPTKPSENFAKLNILPKDDFSKVNATSTTKDPLKDYLHFRETMPHFVAYIPKSYPGYSTDPYNVAEQNYANDLATGKFKYDYLSFAYDAYGLYSIEMSNIRVTPTKKGVSVAFLAFDYMVWGEGDGKESTEYYNFNSAAAINSILRYFMPKEGGVLFSKLQNDQFHFDEPVKYLKDKCTVTIRNTTGPAVIDIAWN